ncbi:carboxymuconolactone decarboxylase family protein [Streptomyces sp. SID8375]|uniref:carboxymuconolactone decarboxylase family protein n=1 Tax=Streptomyces TaxID=1883 RepID=UPI00037B626F|nr:MULTISPECIES: carboxymuconolactone decarboxylase family protein [unclassified Streptomyces]MYT11790.1 carboxymuconolactone decarboxylase family protein [Streptomyces sp. SID4951]MYX11194.1 carboxymuconolactone decarboxylase family protein [Streptomyces sp. SID8375]SCK12147.1 alkylhydroperoxidase AhpD family core domain-containing protein [Streptomyces sp. SceaMP-e96]
MTNEAQLSKAQLDEADQANESNQANEVNEVNGAVGRSPRVNFAKAAPKAFKALIGFDAAAREGLDPALVELVQIRSSQLNKCAYCLHMHTTDARKAGESEERLHMVAVWQEAPHFFTPKEQAALALTEAVTLVAQGGVPDAVYQRAAAHFDEPELARLLALIFTINTWNRLALSTGKVAGTDER